MVSPVPPCYTKFKFENANMCAEMTNFLGYLSSAGREDQDPGNEVA
jgi:hypothetical protein